MVDLTHYFPWTFIFHISRSLIMFNIIHAILKDKYNSFVTFATIVCSSFLFCWFAIDCLPTKYEVFFIIGLALLVFLLCVFLCEGSIPKKILANIISLFAVFSPTLILQLVFSLTGIGNFKMLSDTNVSLSFFLSFCLFIYASSFILVFFIKLFKIKVLKNENEIKTAKSIYFFIFPITHILCFFSLVISEQAVNNSAASDYNNKFNFASILFVFICFVIDISIVFFAEHVNSLELKNIENEKIIVENSMTYEQTLMLKKEKSEFRKIKHDMSNLITTATGYIDIGKPEKAKEILTGTGTSILISGANYCSDETLNTVIYLKHQKAEEAGVKLSVDIDESAGVSVEGYDFCRLLHNLIDNSINAAQETQNRIAEIHIKIKNDFIGISTSNNFEKNKKSSKKISKIHGYGTQIIKDIAKKYNGKYEVRTDNNLYFTETVINNKAISTDY